MTAAAAISFHNTSFYGIELGTELLVLPAASHQHLFDLTSMTVRRLR